MRVLHINCNYIGTTLHQLMIEHLDALGYDDQVFVPTSNRNISVIEPSPNVCVCECFNKWDRLVFCYKQQKIQKALKSRIPVASYDLIHAYTLFTDGNCARNLSKAYGCPYVVAVRNTDVNDFFRRLPFLRKRGVQIMRDAAAVFFLSDAYRRQVFDQYVPPKYQAEIQGKTYIIPNGIDDFWLEHSASAGKEIDRKAINLVYAGKIDRNKNIPTIQKAMKILRTKGYESTLTVVGNILDKREFEKIQSDVFTKYLAAMPKEELMWVYRASDIFVMPSFTESFGLVYAEAMSQGLPVVYSKGQGFDHQFDEGFVGYHVSADNPEDVAGGIKRVVDSYSKLQRNVVQASKTFRWAEIVQKYDQVYRFIKETS